MIIVSGKTWLIKDRLSAMGGRFIRSSKTWEFDRLCQEHRDEIKRTVGVLITENSETEHSEPLWQGPRHTPMTTVEKPRKTEQTIEEIIEDILAETEERPTKIDHLGRTNIFGDDETYFNHFDHKNPISYFGFSSLSALIKYIRAIPRSITQETANGRNEGWSSSQSNWKQSESMEDALNIAMNGWTEGNELAQQITDQLEGENALQRRIKYSVAGGSFNVGRLLSGNPMHMKMRSKQDGRKIITFFSQSFMSSGIYAHNAIVRAAVVAAIVDILEQHGYQCEIVSACTTATLRGKRGAFQIITTLKHAGEALNLSDIVFGLGHPAYFRRLMFGVAATDEALRSVWEYMGQPAPAFNKSNPTTDREIYIKQLSMTQQEKCDDEQPIIEQALQIWDMITDDKLPMEIKHDG